MPRQNVAVPDPETRFAKVGDDRVAYQLSGEGPVDLLYCGGVAEPIDWRWEYPPSARFLERVGSFSRLIAFDRRGTGASDAAPVQGTASWEIWAEDARAVLDAVGSRRAVIWSTADGGPTAMLFAATQPHRTHALVLFNASARVVKDSDYPWGLSESDLDKVVTLMGEVWGTEAMAAFANPGAEDDAKFRHWYARAQRATFSPREAATYFRWAQYTDVRSALSSIRVPTLVLHRKNAAYMTVDQGRYLAEHISGARFVALDGANMAHYIEPYDDLVEHLEDFLKRFAVTPESDRALAAVLFTDIVNSTSQAAAMGDTRWRNLLDSHDVVTRTLIEQYRGHLVKLTGDGVLARFDGPGRAIRCAFAVRDALQPLGIDIRAGLHTGEIELRGADIGGIAVHIAQRVNAAAEPGEVLVSETVPRLVTGSGIEFSDRGEYDLKGVPGQWRLYSVVG
jgi:class 3 adenylate cyclase/pimeloyl-ACP methyl ester carboxylesterase